MTAYEVLPLIASLAPAERIRLLRLVMTQPNDDRSVYEAAPPGPDEFSTDEEPLAWDADGWDPQE